MLFALPLMMIGPPRDKSHSCHSLSFRDHQGCGQGSWKGEANDDHGARLLSSQIYGGCYYSIILLTEFGWITTKVLRRQVEEAINRVSLLTLGLSSSQDPKIVLYSPEELGLGKSGKAEGFPFRWLALFERVGRQRNSFCSEELCTI